MLSRASEGANSRSDNETSTNGTSDSNHGDLSRSQVTRELVMGVRVGLPNGVHILRVLAFELLVVNIHAVRRGGGVAGNGSHGDGDATTTGREGGKKREEEARRGKEEVYKGCLNQVLMEGKVAIDFEVQ